MHPWHLFLVVGPALGLVPLRSVHTIREESQSGFRSSSSSPSSHSHDQDHERCIVQQLAAAGLLSIFIAGLHPATAFENGVPELMEQYKMQAKYPGTQPELGLQANGKLARCTYEPNCFSTSGDEAHLLKP